VIEVKIAKRLYICVPEYRPAPSSSGAGDGPV